MNKIKKSVINVELEDLTNYPDYTGNKNKAVSIKNDESGIEFTPPYKSGLYQNAIINGDMKIAQRGTSFASLGAADYTLDRWRISLSALDELAFTVSQDDTDVPNSKFNYSIKINITTAETTLDNDEIFSIGQYIEGYNFKPFVGGHGTLSFWVKSNKTGIFCASFLNSGFDRCYIMEYTINSADTWEFKELTLQFNYSGGDWNYTNGKGLGVWFHFAAGSNWYGAKDTWITTNDHATSNQVDLTDNTDNYINITGVQLNEGNITLPFQHKHFTHELELCQRYYCKSYDIDVAPGTASKGGYEYVYLTAVNSANYAMALGFSFPIRMRIAPPTVISYAYNGTINSCNMAAGTVAANVQNESQKGAYVDGVNGAVSTSRLLYYHWTADAEL